LKNDKWGGSSSSSDLTEDTTEVSVRFSRGLEFLKRSEVDRARRVFEDIIDESPDYSPAHFGLGCVYIRLDLKESALEALNRALELEPGYGEAHLILARLLYENGDFVGGYNHVNKAVQSGVSPDSGKELIDSLLKSEFKHSVESEKAGIETEEREQPDELEIERVKASFWDFTKKIFKRYKDVDITRQVKQEPFSKKNKLLTFISENVKDLIYLLLLIFFSVYFGNRFFRFEFLNTGYPDWIYHAYRIRSLLEYGFLTWSNDWVGGFPIWQSYQFLPHFITAGVQILTGWSITKSMVVVTGLLFILLRIIVYLTARFGGFSPEAGFISSILSFAIIGYQGPIREFSLLWGVTLFPLILLKAYRLKSGNGSLFIYAILIGSSIYIHPILAVISGIILCLRLIVDFKWSYKEMILALIICALISSFYWFPLFLGDKPVHVDPWILSTQWQRENMPRQLFGLSFSLIVTGIIATGSLIKRKLDRWTTIIFSSAIVLIIIISLTYMGYVPKIVNLLMPTRWTPFLGLLFSLLAASLIDWLKKFKHFTLLLPIIILLIIYEGYFISQSLIPLGTNESYNVESEWVLAHPSDIIYSEKILIESVPDLSFFAFGKVRTTGHYFVQGTYDLLVSPLKWLFFSEEAGSPLTQRNFELIELYLKATGTTHVMVSSSKRIAQALLPGGVFEEKLTFLERYKGLAIFCVPWEPVQAFYTSLSNSKNLTFPDISYAKYEKQQLRDELVARFNEVMYSPDCMIINAEYPSQTEIKVELENVEMGNYLIILAQYDGAWRATINQIPIAVERNGPNYIGIDISEYSGNFTIVLIHKMHWTWKVGISLTLIGIISGIYLTINTRKTLY